MNGAWSPLALLLAFAVLQATMLAVAIASQTQLTRATLALSGLMFVLAATLIVPLLQAIGLAQEWPRTLVVLSGLPYLFGPLLLLHVAAITAQPSWTRARTWVVHLLLPGAYALLALWLLQRSDAELAGLFAMSAPPARLGLLPLSKLVSLLVYAALSWLLLQRFERNLRAQLAETSAYALRSLRALVWSAAALSVLMAAHLLFGIGTVRLDEAFAAAVSMLILLAGFHGLRQTRIPALGPSPSEDAIATEGEAADQPLAPAVDAFVADVASIHTAPVAEAELPPLVERVQRLAREPAQLFDHDLSLARLAKTCKLTQNQLSHVLNHGIGAGFYDFVNRLRVEAVQVRLRDPAVASRPILDLAFECGFSTKTTFNKAFRAVTGETPSTWRARARASGHGAPENG